MPRGMEERKHRHGYAGLAEFMAAPASPSCMGAMLAEGKGGGLKAELVQTLPLQNADVMEIAARGGNVSSQSMESWPARLPGSPPACVALRDAQTPCYLAGGQPACLAGAARLPKLPSPCTGSPALAAARMSGSLEAHLAGRWVGCPAPWLPCWLKSQLAGQQSSLGTRQYTGRSSGGSLGVDFDVETSKSSCRGNVPAIPRRNMVEISGPRRTAGQVCKPGARKSKPGTSLLFKGIAFPGPFQWKALEAAPV